MLGVKADKQVGVCAADCLSLTNRYAVLIVNSGRESQLSTYNPCFFLSVELSFTQGLMWPRLTNGM